MIVDFRITLPGELIRRDVVEARYLDNYNRIYRERGGAPSVDKLLDRMRAAGVERAVLQAEWAYGDYRQMNAAVNEIVKANADTLAGFLTVNPNEPDDMVAVADDASALGMKGINLQPFSYGVFANDRRFWPLYRRCQELGLIVSVHSSINFSSTRPIRYGHPAQLDDIACDFPDLRLVANHGGWPWVLEMVAIAWKHKSVFIEIGAVSPKYIADTGTGWEPLMRYGNSLLQDQVLFATDCMLPFERAVSEAKQLPLKEEVKAKWLGGNARRLLGWE